MSQQDIDCAHRVGAVTDKGKQTMLVRFFARDLAEDVMKNKRNLKGTGILIYEDTTWMNRQLITELKDRDDVDSVWLKNGTIWVRLEPTGRKFKISIADDVETKLAEKRQEFLENPAPPVTPEQIAEEILGSQEYTEGRNRAPAAQPQPDAPETTE